VTASSTSNKSKVIVPLLCLLLLLFAYLTTGIRGDHIFLILVILLCYFISSLSRRLITGLGIIIVYWVIYDSMKAWPNYALHSVDIQNIYNTEKNLFGMSLNGIIVTPNEYFLAHTSMFLDLLCGLFYLSWVPLPLIFALYLFSKNSGLFLRFCLAFFTVNILGFIIYYVHPAAPPWYYATHGAILDTATKGSAAGLLRTDHLLGIKLFEGIYSKGSNVFAAMPSLHSSYPLIGLVYAFKLRSTTFSIIFFTFMLGIWFSAIYLSHHYILDVIAGVCCGILGILLLEKILLKTNWMSAFLNSYEKMIKK
jgi:hypothetical protein